MRNDHFRSIFHSNTQNYGGIFTYLNDVLFNWDLLQKEIKEIKVPADNNQKHNCNDDDETKMSKSIINQVHESMENPMKILRVGSNESQFK